MVFRTDRLNKKFTHKANVSKYIPHNVTTANVSGTGPPKSPPATVTAYHPVGARGTKYTPKSDVTNQKQRTEAKEPFYGPFQEDKNYADQTVTDLPTTLKQAVNDDRLGAGVNNKLSWTDKLYAALPSVEVRGFGGFDDPAYAEHIDTKGNADKDAKDDALMSVYDKDNTSQVHPDREPPVWYNPMSWFGNMDFGEPTNYGPNAADAAEPEPTAVVYKDGVKTDTPYPGFEHGLSAMGSFENADGKFTKATQPIGTYHAPIKDYVANTQSSSFYSLPGNISPSQHQTALDRQSMAKFENNIQKSWSNMLRDSNRPNADSFSLLKDKINNSNVSQAKKDALLKEYTIKKDKYQKAAGGYGSNDPWSFGNSSAPKNPNKAEKLKAKINSGDFTPKEYDQYQTLTGNTQLYSGVVVTRADGTIKPKVLTYKDLY